MDVKKRIIQMLDEVEENHKVKVLYAIENGSRVWGMSSRDSDYDVRFIYIRKKEDYLRIHRERDVIEVPEDKEHKIDMVGFDIYKFFGLLKESNPTVIEWLVSSIVYRNVFKGYRELREFIEAKFNPMSLFHHYKSMCKNNYLKYIKSGTDIRHKRYLYCLRGLVNAVYVMDRLKVPPISFQGAAKVANIPKDVKASIGEIIRVKKDGMEKDKIGKIPVFDKEIEGFIESAEQPEPRKMHAMDIFNRILFKNLESA